MPHRILITLAALSLVIGCTAQPPTGASPAPTGAGPGATQGAVPTGETPKPGGILTYLVNVNSPPTYDAHASNTFGTLMPVSPFYSTLYRLDPADNVSKIIPDVADGMPEVSADKLTYTIKLKQNVKFHSGQPLTAADVVATYNKIMNPPQGVVSARKGVYAAVESVTASGDDTVVFKLKYPTASFLASIASPWNYLYRAERLAQDPAWYAKNIEGTGPFKFVEYVAGSHMAGTKNPDYHEAGKPYLDGFKAVFMTDVNRQTQAIKAKQAMIEFRGFTPQQRDELSRSLGNDLAIQESSWVCNNVLVFNTTIAPFSDERVRRALSLGLDRWSGSETLSKQTIVKGVGGLMRPGGPFAMADSELEKIPGFYRDNAKAVEEAKKLLADAGVPDLTLKLHNRNLTTPYEPVALWVINEWKKIGVTATHEVKETAAYTNDLRGKAYEVGVEFNCDYFDEPDLQLAKFWSVTNPDGSPGPGAGLNTSHYSDPKLDDMIRAQAQETDPEKRKQLVWEIERYAMGEKAYIVPVLWWYRIIPHLAIVRGYTIGSNHYTTMDMASIWLAE